MLGQKGKQLEIVMLTQVKCQPSFAIIKQRERIKRQTIEHRRLQHRKLAASYQPQDEADIPLANLRRELRQMF